MPEGTGMRRGGPELLAMRSEAMPARAGAPWYQTRRAGKRAGEQLAGARHDLLGQLQARRDGEIIEGLTKTRTMSRARRNFCQGMSVENRSRAELACHKDGVTLWAQSMNCMHYAVISAKNNSAVSG